MVTSSNFRTAARYHHYHFLLFSVYMACVCTSNAMRTVLCFVLHTYYSISLLLIVSAYTRTVLCFVPHTFVLFYVLQTQWVFSVYWVYRTSFFSVGIYTSFSSLCLSIYTDWEFQHNTISYQRWTGFILPIVELGLFVRLPVSITNVDYLFVSPMWVHFTNVGCTYVLSLHGLQYYLLLFKTWFSRTVWLPVWFTRTWFQNLVYIKCIVTCLVIISIHELYGLFIWLTRNELHMSMSFFKTH